MGYRLTKLRAFLLADIIILAMAIGGFYYLDSLVPSSARFEVSDLNVDQDWVQVGDPVYISVKVTNVGEQSGIYSVLLMIDDEEIEWLDVELLGKQSEIVVFTVAKTVEGEYVAVVEDLTVSFKVTLEAPPRQAELQLVDLRTSRSEAAPGETLTISVMATNIGDVSGRFGLDLFVNNEKRETKEVELAGGETKTVYFDVTEELEGEYEVKLLDLVTSFKISSDAQDVKPAEFQVTNLSVNPLLALPGETVKVSARVTNIGETSGGYTVNLEVNGAVRRSIEVSLAGGASELVEFELSESNPGEYRVEIHGLSDKFVIEDLPAASANVRLHSLAVSPYEVWAGDAVNIRARVDNLSNEPSTLQVRLSIIHSETDKVVESTTRAFSLDGGVLDVSIELSVNAQYTASAQDKEIDRYVVSVVNVGNQSNSLRGFFQVAPEGFHTLAITRAGGGSRPMIFTFDGVEHQTPYRKLLPVGDYQLSTDEIVDVGTGIVEFSHWNDGVTSASRTLTLDRFSSVIAHYIVISGYASCPSLYIWNGTGYTYITEVSNAGWLGYMDYIDEQGNIVYGGGNPWDYVKLDNNFFQPRTENGTEYYDVVLFQQWDEIFYLDTAYLVAVDHPKGTDVYSTMSNYVNPGFYGEIYTVNPEELLTPISAINEKGQDVLPHITHLDGIFTPGSNGLLSPSWNNLTLNQLTLNLGDLSDASEIKLVIHGLIDWGPPEPYYEWIDHFKTEFSKGLIPNGTQIYPPPYMEVMDGQGNWIRVPQDRQMPIPADYVPRTFAVDLTDLFPKEVEEYKIRITNFWNVTFDYIGIDISTQKDIAIHEVMPTATLEPLDFGISTSNVSGNFTQYGDVTPLLLEANDMFVIGMQGDKVALKFPTTNLPSLEEGMERSYFLFVACWFKDPPDNWGYGFEFTVEPLPFQNMSGFPYPPTENYPSTEEHINYLKEWNTRQVNLP